MKLNRATSVDDCRLLTSFEAVRRTLLSRPFSDRLEKPLAFWVLPNDRRLPLAFLPRTIGDLVNTSFTDLSATPGVGHKKIHTLVELLNRATEDTPANSPRPSSPSNGNGHSNGSKSVSTANFDVDESFHPELVSELIWTRWRETVRKHGLEHEKLGFLAPTLNDLPTVIWYRPLSFYLGKTLDEIRSLKTHGEKRVCGVLEVFYTVNRMLASVRAHESMMVRISPRFVVPIDAWVTDRLIATDLPPANVIRERLCEPLLAQVSRDIGPQLAKLARGRLGLNGEVVSVKTQAEELNVTRTRVYQLLDDCSRVMAVRWSEGRCRVGHLLDRFRSESGSQEHAALDLLADTMELFFSPKHVPE